MSKTSEILQWVLDLERIGIQLRLEKTQQALELLGNPQHQFKSVLVGGTNGKGSTATFLSKILEANGYKTGLYTSPHLVDITERFQTNQKPISKKAFEREAIELREILTTNRVDLTHFEFLTTLALQWFAKQKIEWAVLEIGMGGRLDSTNAVAAEAGCITNIALDHQKYLGNSIREIAFEKAGIIKKEKPIITSEKDAVILQLFSELALAQKSPFFTEGKEYSVQFQKTSLDGTVFDFSGFGAEWKGLETRLIGEHQAHNAGLALATLFAIKQQQSLRLGEEKTRAALQKTVWPGRFEILSTEPLVILDCCHNPHGAEAFAKTLQAVLPNRKAKWLVGISEGRKPSEMLKWFAPFASEMTFSTARFKGLPTEELLKVGTEFLPSFRIKSIPSVSEATKAILKNSQASDTIIIAGSVYLVGEALQSAALKKMVKPKKAKQLREKANRQETESHSPTSPKTEETMEGN